MKQVKLITIIYASGKTTKTKSDEINILLNCWNGRYKDNHNLSFLIPFTT